MKKKRIVFIGAGPGGLSAAMILAHRGFDVHMYEKASMPGGRNASFTEKGFTFDLGPTFLMMKYILDEIFAKTGRKSEDYLEFARLSPMYRLEFADKSISVYEDSEKMKKELAKLSAEDAAGLDRFLKREKRRFESFVPVLQKPNTRFADVVSRDFLRMVPNLAPGKSLYGVLSDYFKTEEARLSFTFQSKYLGMSPWECPGGFSIIPFVEHAFGIYHVIGGLSKISEAMARVVEEEGGKIHYDSAVKRLIVEGRSVRGIELVSGEKIEADEVVINADFGYAMENLVPEGLLKKYTPANLAKKKISCSTFMVYLGLDRVYDLETHTIVFAREYRKNIDDIFGLRLTEGDISLYVRNAAAVDPTLAPKGKSALYILVPVANNRAGIDWKKMGSKVRDDVFSTLRDRLGLEGVEKAVEFERIIAPDEWEKDFNVYEGAVFNLAHNLKQMLWFRPHNKFEELDHCYIVGGGTHPGSGLPTIYESGRIVGEMIK